MSLYAQYIRVVTVSYNGWGQFKFPWCKVDSNYQWSPYRKLNIKVHIREIAASVEVQSVIVHLTAPLLLPNGPFAEVDLYGWGPPPIHITSIHPRTAKQFCEPHLFFTHQEFKLSRWNSLYIFIFYLFAWRRRVSWLTESGCVWQEDFQGGSRSWRNGAFFFCSARLLADRGVDVHDVRVDQLVRLQRVLRDGDEVQGAIRQAVSRGRLAVPAQHRGDGEVRRQRRVL